MDRTKLIKAFASGYDRLKETLAELPRGDVGLQTGARPLVRQGDNNSHAGSPPGSMLLATANGSLTAGSCHDSSGSHNRRAAPIDRANGVSGGTRQGSFGQPEW